MRGKLIFFKLLTSSETRSFATRQSFAKVRLATDAHEPSIAAHRETEEANTLVVNLLSVRPSAKQKINEAFDISRSFNQDRKIIDAALIESTIARVNDGCDNKARIYQRRCSVLVSTRPTCPTM